MQDTYLTAAGAFLPGLPVSNDAIAQKIGLIDAQSERLGRLILRQNRIKTRHYAIDDAGQITQSNASMAASAAKAALENSNCSGADVDLLATATTQGDLLVPGHASAVHGELATALPDIGMLEVANFQSVCASASMAMRTAYLNIKAGEKKAALICGSEFSSRWFRPEFYQGALDRLAEKETRMSAEFLRWTLSDGAGAVLFEPAPSVHQQSFKVDWITLHSLADRFDVCMYAGSTGAARHDLARGAWAHYADGPGAAVNDGAVMLLQDMVLLKKIIRGWVGEYLRLIDDGKIIPDQVDWLLCHYSAHSLREELIRLLKASGAMIDEEKWFSNLPTKGNTGAGALFIMFEEFMSKGLAKPGDRILCVNPESGRAIVSFMMMTAQ